MLSTRQSSNPHHQPSFPTRRSSDLQAIRDYGSDKPDTRFDMKIRDYTTRVQGQGFQVFDNSPFIGGLLLEEKADEYTNRLIKISLHGSSVRRWAPKAWSTFSGGRMIHSNLRSLSFMRKRN